MKVTLIKDINDYLLDSRYEKLANVFNKFSDDKIKSAEILLPEELAELDNNHFALVLIDDEGVTRKYACSNEDMAIFNTELFLEDCDIMPDEICKVAGYYLLQACKKFNYMEGINKLANYEELVESNVVLLDDIDKIKLHYKKEANSAIKPSAYALPDEQRYPLASKEDVEAAIEYFDIYEDHFKQAEKLVYALNTAQAAKNYEINLDDSKHKIAEFSNLNPECLNQDLPAHLSIRKYLASDEYTEVYNEFEAKLAEFENPLQIMDALTKIDTEAGLSLMWGSALEDPIKCCLQPIKTASIRIDGRTLTLTDMQRLLEHEKVAEYLDESSIASLRNFDALNTFSMLPSPVRTELYKLL